MEINKEIYETLKEFNIDKDAGVLVLLGIYFKLDVDKVCPEEVIKSINTTKIIDKDYRLGGLVKWNIPLLAGQEIQWAWVKEWNDGFGRVNPNRKDNLVDTTKRMQEFFAKYPQYRREDVIKARNMYFASISSSEYLKSSAKFIFNGIGGSKVSMLLTWCEKATANNNFSQQKGDVLS